MCLTKVYPDSREKYRIDLIKLNQFVLERGKLNILEEFDGVNIIN